MLPKTISSYGGPYADEGPVENPETQIASSFCNRFLEDLAQSTRASTKAFVQFDTTAAAPAVLSPSAIAIKTQWGSGASYKPAVEKTATGLYTVTFAATYADALGESETVGFADGWLSFRPADGTEGDDPFAKILTVAANVITIATYDANGTGARTKADTMASGKAITMGVYLL